MQALSGRVDLNRLRASVANAREAVASSRRLPVAADRQRVVQAARHGLLRALEALISGLSATGQPVPYRLRDEIALNRALERDRVFQRRERG